MRWCSWGAMMVVDPKILSKIVMTSADGGSVQYADRRMV